MAVSHNLGRIALRAFVFAVLWLVATASLAPAQQPNDDGRKQARAVRVPNGSVRLDGQLEDAAWSQAPAVADFVQKEPVEGAPTTEAMEVRFVYDDSAMYVGARMYSSHPEAIQAPMSRRDNVQEAEYLLLSFDTYLDRRTAYTFGVTASGVRLDQYHASDNEDNPDLTYDPVWQARTRIDEKGWTAEFWLPFSQLRFNEASEMIWGLNIHRWTPTLNEDDYWMAIPRTDRGWASRFGMLRGIEGVESPRRLELYPYVAASSRITGNRDPANPFDDGRNLETRVGADLKLALGSNLTLDATVNPDFGQVEADPAEVNLSTTETIFSERRPFFLEGNSLLTGPSTNYYYSRRIGARPVTPALGDFIDYPGATTILGAAKITGRLASGISIGALGAITAEEWARTYQRDTSAFSRNRVAPRTTYAVSRVQQEFGTERSTVGMQFTAVGRDLPAGDPLADLLVRRAFTGAANTQLRFGRNTYELAALASFSYIEGEPAALERVQRSSVHYFQRPDRAGGILLDPSRRSMAGSKVQASFDKIAGQHWLWGGAVASDSPGFEPNDLGRLNDTSDIPTNFHLNYRETSPGRLFRSYSLNTSGGTNSDWDRDLGVQYWVNQNSNWTWHKFWTASLGWSFDGRSVDPLLTRGGPAMGTPRRWNVNGSLRNSNSSQTRWNGIVSYTWDENGDSTRDVNGSFSLRPAPAWQLSFTPKYVRELSSRQYVTQMGGGRPETYGGRYIFGSINRSTISMQVRLNYTFKPDLNLDFYAEPFAASGRYDRFGELLAARSRHLRFYGEDGTTITRQPDGSSLVTDGTASFTLTNRDFKTQSLRSNLVLRWEWRPGSTMYLVWQQNRSGSQATRAPAGFRALFGSLSAPGENFFAVKTTFRISTK
ncbi:MAG: carbohydrate binding family 9 domain-containing protein [Acidobacteria bacterium]|nr:carbohydrate binding family 9 domain-containing protein [Acidobacteriota bacterium]